jgi:predicted XRE-type DNA-binding protein
MPSGSRSRDAKPRASGKRGDAVRRGSGNVFADLNLPEPEIALAKAQLVQRIRELITRRKLTQARAGEILGLHQPKVSALLKGQVEGYSIDRLFRFLNALGQQVRISVRPVNRQATAAERRGIVVTR